MFQRLRQIKNYSNYFISDIGQAYSISSKRILKSRFNIGGYQIVNLYKQGIKKDFMIHCLVLEAFIGFCPKGMQACHKDNNRANNNLSNLRWDTPQNNHLDRVLPSSGVHNLSWDKYYKYWHVYGYYNGKRITIKSSKDKQVCIDALNEFNKAI